MKRELFGQSPSMRRLYFVAVSTLFSFGTVSCGESAPPPVAPTAEVKGSDAVLSMTYFLAAPKRNNEAVVLTAQALQSALVAAGFRVIAAENEPHDVTLRLSVATEEQRSLFMVSVNGKQSRKFAVKPVLSAVAGGEIVDEMRTEFTSDGTVTEQQFVRREALTLAGIMRLARERAREIRP